MLFGVDIAAYPFFFLISVVICVNERRKFSVLGARPPGSSWIVGILRLKFLPENMGLYL
jgi:hypothetical protein